MQNLTQHFHHDMASGLAEEPVQPVTDSHVANLKRIVKRARGRLRLRHRLMRDGSAICHAQTEIVDALIEHLFAGTMPMATDDLTVVALGGYGRFELCPCSDVDIMFLSEGRPDAHMKDVINRILYTLWDVGFTVGHSVRSIDECIEFARKDIHIRTGLMDARLLSGSRTLFDKMMQRLYEKCFTVKRQEFLKALMAEQAQRREKYGSSVCLQEPNIKDGAGGLRDLHMVWWSLEAASPNEQAARWEEMTTQTPAVNQAYHAILKIRNELHFLVKRRIDILTLDIQSRLAHHLHYQDSRTLRASESLMRDYYRHARVLLEFQEHHWSTLLEPKRSWLQRAPRKLDVFQIRNSVLSLNGHVGIFDDEPIMMLRAFDYAQAATLALDPSLQGAMRRSLPRVGAALRRNARAAEIFLTLLHRRGRVGTTLRLMHDTGFLGQYLPAFGRITFLVQHDSYHRYTIDEHTLIALEALDRLENHDVPHLRPFREIFESIRDVGRLYLAVLLHDIGKGRGGGHVEKGMTIAHRIGRQLRLSTHELHDVVFLIEHHLLMSQISQRRDIDDEDEIRNFAGHIGTVERLKMLLLLTYADLYAVGPDVLTEWKAVLLLRLYNNTERFLERGHHQPDTAELTIAVLEYARNAAQRATCLRHLERLPPRYLTANAPARIVEHALAAERVPQEPLVALWSETQNSGMTELNVCTMNRHGLFALITGVLAMHGVNVLGAQINTRTDDLALDGFQVSNPDGNPLFDPRKKDEIVNDLETAIVEDGSLSHLDRKVGLRPAPRRAGKTKQRASTHTEVRIDNTSSPSATIIEVQTGDHLGLVYHLARTLSEAGLDIGFARIATIKNDILDVFYVTDQSGEKVAADRCAALQKRLVRAVKRVDGGQDKSIN